MPGPHTHRARYAPLHSDSGQASYASHVRSFYREGRSYLERTWRGFLALPPEQRYIIYVAVGVKLLILAVVLYIGPEAMFNATAKLAIWFGAQSFGAVLLIALVVIVSFPPLVGYGTTITLFGLGWGVHADATSEHAELTGNLFHAWLLASTACLLGASIAFGVLRFLIVHHSKRVSWISNALNDPKYVALSTAVRRRGLSMAILIRFCPFPFAYSNLFFASLVDAVSFPNFLAATALITPKLFLHVWLGTRMFQLMDREQRAQLDGWAKALNVIYILVGSAVGAATGWLVWSETTKVLETIEREQQSNTQHHLHGPARHTSADSPWPPDDRQSTTDMPYSDAPKPSERGSLAASPFVLDLDQDADEVEDQLGHGSHRDHRNEEATNNLIPR